MVDLGVVYAGIGVNAKVRAPCSFCVITDIIGACDTFCAVHMTIGQASASVEFAFISQVHMTFNGTP